MLTTKPQLLFIGSYTPTAAFRSIPEMVCLHTADRGLVATLGPIDDPKTQADAVNFCRAINSNAALLAIVKRCSDFMEMNGGARMALVEDARAALKLAEG